MKKSRKSAQSLIEYGLILALVAIIALTVLSRFGRTITDAGARTDQTVTNVSTGAGQNYCDSIGGAWDPATSICTPP